MSKKKEQPNVPISQKFLLDYHEASEYFNIGINRLRDLTKEPGCDFVSQSGETRRQMIIRPKFEEYILSHRYL